MGEEADADWDTGLVERGREDGIEYLRNQLAKAKKVTGKLGDRVEKAEKAERNMAQENRKLRQRIAYLESTFQRGGGTGT